MQATLAICSEPILLSPVDLKDLEWLTVERPMEDSNPATASDISEQRRMAIVLLLAEVSVLRGDYGFPN